MNDIIAAIRGLKGAMDIARSLVGVRDQAILQSQLIDLQQKILDAQASTTSARAEHDNLQEERRALQRRIDDLENWEQESAKYELKEIVPGVFAYASKIDPAVPSHLLCTSCFGSRRKSIIQKTQETRHGIFYIHRCPTCSATYEFEERPWGGTATTYTSEYDPYGDL